MNDDYGMLGGGYADDESEIGIVTAVEQTTGNKNSMFSGWGRNISVAVYQWLIVTGAIVLLWGLYFGFISDLKVG